MWNDTAATRRLGIEYPIVQGPFGGGLSSPVLAAVVSNAGGLGSFGAHHLAPAQIGEVVAEIRALTAKPFVLNLWVSGEDAAMADFSVADFERQVARLKPCYDALGVELPAFPDRFGHRFDEQAEALIEAAPPIFSFVFGIPAPQVLDACRARGIVTMGTVTTLDEALAMEAAGVDVIIATGFEAGGHRVSFLRSAEESLTGTIALIPQIADRVRIPIVAAGGIADGRGVAAALALGADAVQIGTAFLACAESAASGIHRETLFTDAARDTVLTRAFSGRLARGVRNRFVEEMAPFTGDFAPYPAQGWLTGRFKAAAVEQGRADLIALWAGQGAALLEHRDAGALFAALVRDTTAVMDRMADRMARARRS